MNYLFPFERLEVWNLSRKLCFDTYLIVSKFPIEEKFNLADQIRRAATSVSLNIAEGTSRLSFKEQARFTEMAYGSLLEVYSSMLLAKDHGYLEEETMSSVSQLIKELSNKLNALRSTQMKRFEAHANTKQ